MKQSYRSWGYIIPCNPIFIPVIDDYKEFFMEYVCACSWVSWATEIIHSPAVRVFFQIIWDINVRNEDLGDINIKHRHDHHDLYLSIQGNLKNTGSHCIKIFGCNITTAMERVSAGGAWRALSVPISSCFTKNIIKHLTVKVTLSHFVNSIEIETSTKRAVVLR